MCEPFRGDESGESDLHLPNMVCIKLYEYKSDLERNLILSARSVSGDPSAHNHPVGRVQVT
jgi:hypothetical protein